MELFTLIIMKNNYLEYLDSKLAIHIRAGEIDYFIQQLKKLCRVAPEFTYQPVFYRHDELWCYDSEHFWGDNVGRCSLRFQNSYFGFNGNVNKFECICIDYESFGIKQAGSKKVHNFCGVPIDYITPAQQKLIAEQEQKFKTDELKRQRLQLIAELKDLESSDVQ